MKTQIHQRDNGHILVCALCTIVIVSLIGANVLINCITHYNVTAKQLKGWKEALYAAEAGGDAGFDEVRKALNPLSLPFTTDGWAAAPSPAPTPGPAWTKTISGFGQEGNLSTTVTIDKLFDTTGTIPSSTPYYRIRAVGTARLFGLPRVGLSDQFLAGGPNFVANSASRGVGETLLRKIDFKYDHFKASYGDGDGHNLSLSTVTFPQITRRIELVAVPKYFVFGGAMRVVNLFDGPGSAGFLDSYNSKNPTNPNPGSPQVVNNNIPGPNTTSYYGSNPSNSTYLADAHDGDVSVGAKNFAEGGPIWGDVTTNGGNVTHSGYQISGTIDNNVPFTIPPLPAPDTTVGFTFGNSGTGTDTATGTSESSPTGFVYSGITGSKTIQNGNAGSSTFPYAYAKIVVNGDITGKITVEKGVTAEIWFTGNMKVKAGDLDNQNVDRGTKTANPGSLGVPPLTPPTPADDPNPSRVGHMKFFGISPTTSGVMQTIEIDPPGNIFATFYAPSADITVTGDTDIFSAIVGRSFSGNGNTGFHYDKALNQVDIGVVTDYQVVSYIEDIR
jgi:LysM repeat protein